MNCISINSCRCIYWSILVDIGKYLLIPIDVDRDRPIAIDIFPCRAKSVDIDRYQLARGRTGGRVGGRVGVQTRRIIQGCQRKSTQGVIIMISRVTCSRYLSRWTLIYISASIHRYQSTCWDIPISIDIDKYWSILIHIQRYLYLSSHIERNQTTSTEIKRYRSTSTRISRHWLISVDVDRYRPRSSDIDMCTKYVYKCTCS